MPNNTSPQDKSVDDIGIDYNQKVLELHDLRQYFKHGLGKRRILIKAVDGVSFDIYKREALGLVGESGCGKTTTGRTIIRLYDPTGGSVYLNGVRIGAGIVGYIERIKHAKEKAKVAIIEADELKKAIYGHKKDVHDAVERVKRENQMEDAKLTQEIKSLNQPLEEYKKRDDNLYTHHRNTIVDIKYKYAEDIQSIKQSEADVIKRRAKFALMAEKTKFTKKVRAIKQSKGLTRHEQSARKKELLDELHAQQKKIIAQRAKDIEKAVEKDYGRKEASERIRTLKAERKAALAKENERFKKEKANLHQDLPDKKSILDAVQKAKAAFKEKKVANKAVIQDAKRTAKEAIAKIKADAKAKPDKYKRDEDAIAKVKEQRQKEIETEKAQIRNIKKSRRSDKVEAALTKIQMIFQDPVESLNPRMTVKEIIAEGLRIQGEKNEKVIRQKVFDALKLVGLVPEHAFRYPHEFSGGQRQRIGIARALIVNPDFIVADEPISALDVSIQAQVINLMNELKQKLGLTILFIAHDLSVVKYFCDRIAVMYYGKIVELTSSDELFEHPLHPYTKSLLSAIPQPDPISEKTRERFGYDPRMHDYATSKPEMHEIKPGHFIYANDEELKQYKEELKSKKKEGVQ